MGQDPVKAFKDLEGLRDKLVKQLMPSAGGIKAREKGRREIPHLPYRIDPHTMGWLPLRPMQTTPQCQTRVGHASMDSLALQSSSGSTPNFTTLIELSFLDFHSDLAFPASATPVTSAAAWEGKYRSQIPPHACASHLVFGGRISGTFSWTSNTVLPPRVVFTVAIYVHPDAAVPIPTLAFFLPDLITDTSGRPLNNAWLFTFADTEAGSMSINNIDDWFTVGVDVPAGAQSEVYVSIAASAAAAGGSVQCSGRVFLHWPDPNALFATPPKWVQLA